MNSMGMCMGMGLEVVSSCYHYHFNSFLAEENRMEKGRGRH